MDEELAEGVGDVDFSHDQVSVGVLEAEPVGLGEEGVEDLADVAGGHSLGVGAVVDG